MRLHQANIDSYTVPIGDSTRGIGDLVCEWDSAALINGATVETTETHPNDGVSSAKIPYNASAAQATKTITTVSFSNARNVVVWAYLPTGQSHQTIRLYFTGDSFVTWLEVDFLINKEGWNLYTTSIDQTRAFPRAHNSFAYGDVDTVRAKDLQDLTNTGYSVSVSGDYVLIGNVYINGYSRPKLLFCNDDGKKNLYTDLIDGDSYVSLLAGYNWKGTAYVTTSLRTGDYESWETLEIIANLGWSIANHGYDLETTMAALSQADVEYQMSQARDELNARGYLGNHIALMQGGYSPNVYAAAVSTGMQSVRLIAQDIASMPYGLQMGTQDHLLNDNCIMNGEVQLIAGSISTDSETEADIKAYVDKIIQYGGTGTFYSHGMTSAIRTKLINVFDYIKTKEQQGSIDVVTLDDWWKAL
jgi:hypothetical protein